MIAVIITLTYNQMLLLWSDATWSELQVGYLPTMSIRLIIFGVGWAFCAVIYINQKFIMEPLSNKLVKAYPHIKWL